MSEIVGLGEFKEMRRTRGYATAFYSFPSMSMLRLFTVIFIGLVLLPATAVSGESQDVEHGATVGLDGDTVHVIWKLHIEYDDSQLGDEMDDMLVTLQVNRRMDRALETQLEEMIKQAVERKIGRDYNVECKNLDLRVDAQLGQWTDVTLEFDLDGVLRISKTEREFNMSWKSMKVEGDIRIEDRDGRTVVETYKFTPMQAFGLDWKPFAPELESWEIAERDGVTECYYRLNKRFPIAFETSTYDVEMLFKLPGEPTIKGDLVVYDRNYVPPAPSPIWALLPQVAVAGVAITGVGGSVYLYRRRQSEQLEKKLYKRALARKEFQDFEEALELWGSQSENPRLERRYGWRGGSPVIDIPKMNFKQTTKAHFLDEYLLEE